MANPQIVNLYWDNNWDADNAPAFSRANIDAFTRSLLSTPYFARANQYGVTGASFGGSFTPVARPLNFGWFCGAPRPAGTINIVDLVSWVTCEISHAGTGVPLPPGGNNRNMLYVVYLPSNTQIRNASLFDSCNNTANAFSAFHSATATPQFVFAVVPLACSPTFSQLTVNVTHEIIESLTDPTALEWVQPGGLAPIVIPVPPLGSITIPLNAEAGDVCTPLPAPIGGKGISFFGIQVEAYFSNSDNGCVVGNATVPAFTAPLLVTPTAPNLLEQTSTPFAVALPPPLTPAPPVQWSITSPSTPETFIGSDGVLHLGSTAVDTSLTVTATATDGSGRSAPTNVNVLARPNVVPQSATTVIGGTANFHESHNFPVQWSVVGNGNGSIDPYLGSYSAPVGGPLRNITIVATPTDARRPSAQAIVKFIPYAQLATPGDPVKAGDLARVIYGVCSDSHDTNCIAVYPAKAQITLELSPSVGRIGDPKSKVRQQLVVELAAVLKQQEQLELQLKNTALSPKELDSLRTSMADLQSDHIAKLERQIQEIDFTYHAPTLQKLSRKGIKPGQSLTVTIIATTKDATGTHKAQAQLNVVAK